VLIDFWNAKISTENLLERLKKPEGQGFYPRPALTAFTDWAVQRNILRTRRPFRKRTRRLCQ
jgi:hypothetical protein